MSVLKKKSKERLTQLYIADALKNINEILATHYGGSMVSVSLGEILKENKEPEKTGDEIAADIVKRAGLKMKGG